ncbi:DUF1289 domain-containing protein [Colwellia hornerae]|uniref:DUF1289 domain-containing protein n=1 Tax=Colwellia hornerae TaxID=89402 RepID=A0A5C6QIG0_9GAMM|nr:DUF1289 domain-containing protein [Colwellia hornerae]TWX52454.1 DUF1289 domain-containing protein [Colwellia hornerae]TWX58283.1 DUF1289 domain-containing protein [Colwellia hornerae]TWX68372.1 DUF1289 domain-containing protein [Colwellia hornerae]
MSFNTEKNIDVASPCIRNCCLNGDDVCLGCFRHIDEILAWTSYKNNEKVTVIKNCRQRRIAVQEKHSQGKS